MDIPLEKKRFTKSKILMLVGVVLIIALIVYVIVSSVGGAKLNVQKERISVSTAQQGVFQENVPVNGVVLPMTTIYLDALEGGRVEEKIGKDGAVLEKEEPIFRLSNTDLELSLINQETSVIEAERLYNLNKKLYDKQAIGRQDLIESQNKYSYQKQWIAQAFQPEWKKEFRMPR